jgi:hypothetical protein
MSRRNLILMYANSSHHSHGNSSETVINIDLVNGLDARPRGDIYCADTLGNNNLDPISFDDPCNYALLKQKTWAITVYRDDGDHRASTIFIPVEYCLSESFQHRCTVDLSAALITIVAAANLAQGVFLVMILHMDQGRSSSLVTTDDAIASFLNDPDETTVGACFLGMQELRSPSPANLAKRSVGYSMISQSGRADSSARQVGLATGQIYKPRTCRWLKAATPVRWVLTYLFSLVGLGVITYLIFFLMVQSQFSNTNFKTL